MKRSLLLLFGICLSVLACAQQDVVPDWAAQMGGSGGQVIVQSVAIDPAGNIYLGGLFQGNVNFNPALSGTSFNFNSGSIWYGFVGKYGSSGTPVWVQPIASDVYVAVNSIAIDASNNVYFTGTMVSNASNGAYFTAGMGTGTDPDILIGSFNSIGSINWLYGIGGTSDDEGYDIIQYASTLIVTGNFGGTANFNVFDYSPGVSQGGQDAFVAKYDLSANLNWFNTMGSTSDDFGQTVAEGINGVYVGGTYGGNDPTFDGGGTPTSIGNAGGEDGFIGRYDFTTGAWQYAMTIRSTGDDAVRHLQVDASENLYVAGYFSNTADFFGGTANDKSKNSNGGTDAFVAKYDASPAGLNFPAITWVKTFGGNNDDFCNFVTVDQDGNVYAAGGFKSDVDFNQAASTSPVLKTATNQDGFVVGLASDGKLNFVHQIPGNDDQEVSAVAVNYPYAVMGGIFYQETTFGGKDLTALGDLDGVLGTYVLSPIVQPTNLLLSPTSNNSFSYSFTPSTVSATGYLLVHKAATPSTFVPQDGQIYLDNTTLQDGTVIDYVDAASAAAVNFSILQGITYYVQVYAYNTNAGATNINYLTDSPLTGNVTTTGTPLTTTPTAQPTNMQFNYNGRSFLTVSFDAASDSPTDYLVLRRVGDFPTAVPEDGTNYPVGSQLGDAIVAANGPEITFDDDVVLNATVYYYSVFSYNSSVGASDANRYLTTGPLQAHTDDTQVEVTNISAPASVNPGASVAISAIVNDPESGVNGVYIDYVKPEATGNDIVEKKLTIGTDNSVHYTIPSSAVGEDGIIFWFNVFNNAGLNAYAGYSLVSLAISNLNIPYSSAGTNQTNYRIISIPMVADNSTLASFFGDDLPAADKSKWRMFHYDAGANTELTGSSQLALGYGYWFISSESVSLDVGPGTTASGAYYYGPPVVIKPGWNELGDPYQFPVRWDSVLNFSARNASDVSKIATSLRTYNGSWNTSDQLDPFKGAFVLSNATSNVTLYIPGYKNTSLSSGRKATSQGGRSAVDSDNWQVNLEVTNGDLNYHLGGFGMNPDASDDYDRFDEVNLPRMFNYIEIDHTGKSTGGFPISRDIVSPGPNHTWEFTVVTNGTAPDSELKWDNASSGSEDQQLVLWDEALDKPIDMRSTTHYVFNQKASGKFKVFYGSEDFIKENTRVNGLQLHAVFPNPVSDHMTVSFSLPSNENHVDIAIYNLLGQRIQTVAAGPFESGYHEVQWSNTAQDPVSGLYLVQIKTSEAHAVQRVVFK